jgi:hypothetical protein
MKNKSLLITVSLISLFSCNTKNSKKITDGNSSINNIIKQEQISLAKEFSLKPQIFYIDPTKSNEIRGENGSVIIFPNHSFDRTIGKLKVELIECYSVIDMLLNNLTTETEENKILETFGMINLQVTSTNGDTIKKIDNKILIKIPASNKVKSKVNIFSGKENNGFKKWELTNTQITLINNSIKKDAPYNDIIENTEVIIFEGDQDDYDSIYGKQNKRILPKKTKISKENDIKIKGIKDENLIYYSFQTSNFGWINVDSFLEKDTKEIKINVNKSDVNSKYQLVYSNINSILDIDIASVGSIKQKIVTKNNFTIIGYDIRQGELFFNIHDYTDENRVINFPELKKSSRKEILSLIRSKFSDRSVLP